MESVKQLFQVFTNKELFIEWLLAFNVFIGKKLVKAKARIEADRYAESNSSVDMRKVPKMVKRNLIYNETVLNERWNACLGCEFLTDDKRCTKCGCFMSVKHKMSHASCPVGKWGKYIEGEASGIAAT